MHRLLVQGQQAQGGAEVRHLYSNQCHDESEVWCGEPMYYRDGEPAHSPVDADCIQCLVILREWGFTAAERIGFLKGEKAVRK